MPEHIRALIVILALAVPVFILAKVPATAVAMHSADFARRRNLWIAITVAAFLAHNFWMYAIAAAALLLFGGLRETNKLAMFFFLLFAVPPISDEIPGFGGIRYFFALDYIRLLSLAVLLPAYLSLRTPASTERFGVTLPDKLLAGYMILTFALIFSASTFTGALRHGVFYVFTDIFLPYYVASRSIRNIQQFREAWIAFVVAALVLGAVAAFEASRHWLLYSSLDDVWGVRWGGGGYLERGDTAIVRAQGTAGQPIPLGYVMAVAAGLFLYVRTVIPNKLTQSIGFLLLLTGLAASLSRGPWLGFAVILVAFLIIGPRAIPRLAVLTAVASGVLLIVLSSPIGEKLLDHLPFIGTVDDANITYRQRLFEVSIGVILQSPLFGASDFIHSPAMQDLRQGQGIIDIVNSYLGVGLGSGLVGLFLFTSFFAAAGMGVLRAMRKASGPKEEIFVLGQALAATLLGVLVMIATVSSISVIPVIYWSLAGLCVAYSRMLCAPRVSEVRVKGDLWSAILNPKG